MGKHIIIIGGFTAGFILNAAVGLSQDIKDVRPVVDLPPNYFFWLILLLIVLLILTVLGYVYFKKRSPKESKPRIPPVPAWQKALNRLNELKTSRLLQEGKPEEFYLILSDIVRNYFEDEFQVKAPEMTTEEFLQFLKTNDLLNGAQKNLLREFLVSCDMVKFAKYAPQIKEAENSFALAEQLIRETKEKESIPAKD